MVWNRLRITSLAIIILLCGCIDITPPEKNLLKNPGFEEGTGEQVTYWSYHPDIEGTAFFRDSNSSHSGKASACIINTYETYQYPSIWEQTVILENGAKGAELELSGFIRTEEVSSGSIVAICIQCLDANGEPVAFDTTPQDNRFEGTHDWTEISVTFVTPENADRLVVMALLVGTGRVWFDDLQLVAGEKTAEENLNSALIKAYGSYIISQKGSEEGNEGQNMISFSPPINYESQALLGFWMESEPSGYIKGYRFEKDVGPNYVVEVDLKQVPPGEKIKVNWYAYVFTKEFDYSALPENALDLKDLPEDVREWLKPTAAVQSDHPEIVAKAKELRGDSSDIMEIARRITNFVGRDIGNRGGMQDALTTLRTGGAVCTGHANLAAALFRANGIPCRVLAVSSIPQLQTHYIVEFYVPDYGWVWMESTMGIMPYQPTDAVLLRIVYPEDETPWGVPEHTTIDSTSGIYVEHGLNEMCYQGREILHRYYGDKEEIAMAYLTTKEIGERSINGLKMDLQTIRSVEECATIEDYIAFLNLYNP